MISVSLQYDHNEKPKIDEDWIQIACQKILNDNGHEVAFITIIFSNDLKLCTLKKKYFGENLLTDTISFNLEEKGDNIDGEIYISVDRVKENSKIFNQNIIQEYKRVIIHSCLHLLGYNDDTEGRKAIMTKLEDRYLLQKFNPKKI